MAIESYQIFQKSAEAQGHKGLARSMGLGLSTTYTRTTPFEHREPQTQDEFQKIESMCEANATRGAAGKVANTLAEVWALELFGRLNRNEHPTPLTCELVVQRAQKMCAHMADVLRECRPSFVPDNIAKEAAEMIVELRDLIACAEAADDGAEQRIRVAK